MKYLAKLTARVAVDVRATLSIVAANSRRDFGQTFDRQANLERIDRSIRALTALRSYYAADRGYYPADEAAAEAQWRKIVQTEAARKAHR